MIEFLKFGASWVLPPGIFFVLFLFIAYCCKKRKQTRLAIAITFVTFIFYLASTSYVASMLIGRLEDAYDPPKHLPNADVIIVLGGGAIHQMLLEQGLYAVYQQIDYLQLFAYRRN